MVVKNVTAVDKRRVDLAISAPYDEDVDKVKNILSDIINSHPKVLKDPEPTARLTEYGKDALIYTVRAWCGTENYFDVKMDVLEQVKREFDKNGISIPYTQIDVHLDK